MQWTCEIPCVRRKKARDERDLPATFCFNCCNDSLEDMNI